MDEKLFRGDVESRKGLFKRYYENLKNAIDEGKLNAFEKLKTDEERIRFIREIELLTEEVLIEEEPNLKDSEKAETLKKLANKAFVKGDNEGAFKMYTESLLSFPYSKGSSFLAITLANRSACLYHMGKYQSAINDIDYALDSDYPEDLVYKVRERKAKCLLAEERHEEAMEEFKRTLRALEDSKLPTEKKLKMQADIQIMLRIMTKPKTESGHVNDFRARASEKKPKKSEKLPKLASKSNKIYESMCDKLEIVEDAQLGRYAVAARDISPGEVLLVEKPFSSVLLQEFSQTHCHHCFERTSVPYPCGRCARVSFCSRECLEEGEKSYHKYECPILGNLNSSGISVTVLIALRIITERPFQFFLSLKNTNYNERKEWKKYKSSDYEALYHLIGHENLRKRDDFFERTAMAVFLVRCLKKAGYFSHFEKDAENPTEHENFIGSLILRHLQVLQFNAHEIFEVEHKKGQPLGEARSVFNGGGIFPTLSLFNHSCDPGVVRYFAGTTVIVRAIKPISKGEIVAENYGPIFTMMKRDERRKKLRSQYWFECECKPCIENWPDIEKMDHDKLRIRCDSRRSDGQKFNSCMNVLAVPQNTNDFMVRCPVCEQHTNILKSLKTLQDTDAMYKQAERDAQSGNYQAALDIFLEILSMLDSIMAPPFRDYHLCQQAIRTCMLCLGNRFAKVQ